MNLLNFKKNLFFYVGFFLFFLIVYNTVLTHSFAFADTYAVVFGAFHHQMYVGIEPSFAGGRPIYAVFNYIFCITPTFGSFVYLRLFSIAGIAAFSLLFYNFLIKKTNLSIYESVFISAMFGLMPSFQIYATWVVCSIYPWAAMFAVLSYSTLASEKGSYPKKIALSFVYLCISIMIYQPTAMVYWAVAAAAWFATDQAFPKIRELFLTAFIMVGALVADFIAAKLLPYLIYSFVPANDRTILVSNYSAKAVWFVQTVLRDSLNFVSIGQRDSVSIFFAIFILFGFFVYFPGKIKSKIAKLGLAVLLIPLAYLPNLIVATNWAAYRTQVGVTCLLFLYAVIAFIGIMRFCRLTFLTNYFFAVVLIFCGYIAGQNVFVEFVKPQTRELKIVASYIESQDNFIHTKQLYMVPSSWQDSLAPAARYDEFGIPSSAFVWAVQGMVWELLKQAHSPTPQTLIETALNGPLSQAPKGAKIIDFSNILRQHSPTGGAVVMGFVA